MAKKMAATFIIVDAIMTMGAFVNAVAIDVIRITE